MIRIAALVLLESLASFQLNMIQESNSVPTIIHSLFHQVVIVQVAQLGHESLFWNVGLCVLMSCEAGRPEASTFILLSEEPESRHNSRRWSKEPASLLLFFTGNTHNPLCEHWKQLVSVDKTTLW